MGFAGIVEPCFIASMVVAVNESFITQQNRNSNKSSSWLAQHSVGVMADLDFFIGEDAILKSRTSGTYNVIYIELSSDLVSSVVMFPPSQIPSANQS